MNIFNRLFTIILIFATSFLTLSQENNIKLDGIVVDENNEPIPYAAVGITSKSIGTATTEEGTFYLLVSSANFNDTLEVSSIGFETFKIKVQDYLNLPEKKIVIKEAVMALDEIVISNKKPHEFVKKAIQNLHKNTVNKKHQLKVLYRRFSSENSQTRFLVEHYLNVLDFGPNTGEFGGFEIIAGRKSVDYRFLKKKLLFHPMAIIGNRNPIRNGFRVKDYNWERTGDTFYDGEDILILEGKKKGSKWEFIRLYVGLDTSGIYKVETSDLQSVYIYKKNKDGKLVLSYHNRTRRGKMKLTDLQKKLLKTDQPEMSESYKHEVYVLGIETNSKIVNKSDYKVFKKDMGDIKFTYNADLWNSLSLPPATSFYKKSVKQLESIYGVPLENQFKFANK